MSGDIIAGVVLIAFALVSLTGLFLWSRRIIDRIAARNVHSARALMKELNGDG